MEATQVVSARLTGEAELDGRRGRGQVGVVVRSLQPGQSTLPRIEGAER